MLGSVLAFDDPAENTNMEREDEGVYATCPTCNEAKPDDE